MACTATHSVQSHPILDHMGDCAHEQLMPTRTAFHQVYIANVSGFYSVYLFCVTVRVAYNSKCDIAIIMTLQSFGMIEGSMVYP